MEILNKKKKNNNKSNYEDILDIYNELNPEERDCKIEKDMMPPDPKVKNYKTEEEIKPNYIEKVTPIIQTTTKDKLICIYNENKKEEKKKKRKKKKYFFL